MLRNQIDDLSELVFLPMTDLSDHCHVPQRLVSPKHVNDTSNALVSVDITISSTGLEESVTQTVDTSDCTTSDRSSRSTVTHMLPENESVPNTFWSPGGAVLICSLILIFSTAYLAHWLPRYRKLTQLIPLDERLGGQMGCRRVST